MLLYSARSGLPDWRFSQTSAWSATLLSGPRPKGVWSFCDMSLSDFKCWTAVLPEVIVPAGEFGPPALNSLIAAARAG
jgi:hypothetical protein